MVVNFFFKSESEREPANRGRAEGKEEKNLKQTFC